MPLHLNLLCGIFQELQGRKTLALRKDLRVHPPLVILLQGEIPRSRPHGSNLLLSRRIALKR
jgi:hypothetical protein